jgi:2-polyprenyl-6-methoxyphenol hydroxylase-like FAD-dependent oxidoreductase
MSIRIERELAFAGVGCPWEFQCSLPEWRTEQILAEPLMELGGVVERGVAAASVEERDDGVLVRLERADGTVEAVEAAWVIGAGGAHGVTRASMAEALEGFTYPGRALAADVRVRCGLPRDGSNLVAAPEGYALLAPLPDERWITFVGDLDDGEAERVASATLREAVAAAIARRVAADIAAVDVGWAAPFRMHHRVVSRPAQGRRFLLGDGGHLSSPFGGEGLNSGLHDARDIAWTLALWLGVAPARRCSRASNRRASPPTVTCSRYRTLSTGWSAPGWSRPGPASAAARRPRLSWRSWRVRAACSTSNTPTARWSESTSGPG